MAEVTGAWGVWVVEVTPRQAGVAMLELAEVMLGQAEVVMIGQGEETHWLMMAAGLQWCR